MLGARQETLRDKRHSPRKRGTQLSWIQTPAGAWVLPARLLIEAAEEGKSECRAEVAWQDKNDMALAAAQGGWFCLCHLCSQCQPPLLTVSWTAAHQVTALEAAAPRAWMGAGRGADGAA